MPQDQKPCDAEKLPCHAEKLPDDAYILGPGSFQVSEERYKAEFPDRYCHKTENQTVRHTVVYERQDGRYASNVVTLRAWKARRAIELLQVGCCVIFIPDNKNELRNAVIAQIWCSAIANEVYPINIQA